jgi:hypothetical protein
MEYLFLGIFEKVLDAFLWNAGGRGGIIFSTERCIPMECRRGGGVFFYSRGIFFIGDNRGRKVAGGNRKRFGW